MSMQCTLCDESMRCAVTRCKDSRSRSYPLLIAMSAAKEVHTVWTNDLEERLVDLLEHNPCLYAVGTKDYSNKVMRERTIKNISETLEMEVKEVKKHIHSMRTQYIRYKKLKPSGSGGKPMTHRQKWVLKNLSFLDVHIQARESQSTMPETEPEAEESEEEGLQEEEEAMSPEGPTTPPPFTPVTTPSGSRPSSRSSSATLASTSKGKGKGKTATSSRSDDLAQQELDILRTMANRPIASKAETKPETADEIFGRSVVAKLSAITDPRVKLTVKHQIDNLLFEAEMKQFDVQQPQQQPRFTSMHPQSSAYGGTPMQPQPRYSGEQASEATSQHQSYAYGSMPEYQQL